uniref:Ovule protein n=1 Tax=Schistosoma mansoni TaxID=6183 RepID=A0A5K4F6D9_SCHMA
MDVVNMMKCMYCSNVSICLSPTLSANYLYLNVYLSSTDVEYDVIKNHDSLICYFIQISKYSKVRIEDLTWYRTEELRVS